MATPWVAETEPQYSALKGSRLAGREQQKSCLIDTKSLIGIFRKMKAAQQDKASEFLEEDPGSEVKETRTGRSQWATTVMLRS